MQESHLVESEISKLKKQWVGHVFSSPGTSKRNGVVILIHKRLKVSLLSHSSDSEGRWLIVRLKINEVSVTLFNVYAPTKPDVEFWPHITSLLMSIDSPYVIFGGDCNQVHDSYIDRASKTSFFPSQMHQQFTNLISQRSLVDSWRLCYPQLREYTFFSPVHTSQSCIDYLFVSKALTQSILHADIGSILISDHAPVILDLELLLPIHPSKRWRFNTSLLSDSSFTSSFKASLRSSLSAICLLFPLFPPYGILLRHRLEILLILMSHRKNARTLRQLMISLNPLNY